MSFVKKITLLGLSLFYCLIVDDLQAQSISVGGGLEYNMSIDAVGYNLRAYYNIGKRICFGPEFTSFANTTSIDNGEMITEHSVEYNFNGHYIFELSHKIGTYPVIGINHTRINETYNDPVTNEELSKDINTWAANLGWGAHYNFNRLALFFEYHTNISKPGDHILSIGTFYTIGGYIPNEIHLEE